MEYSQACLCHGMYVEVKGQLAEVGSQFSLSTTQEWNSGHQACCQMLLSPPATSLAPFLYSFQNCIHNYCIYIISTSPSHLFNFFYVLLFSLEFMSTSIVVTHLGPCVRVRVLVCVESIFM